MTHLLLKRAQDLNAKLTRRVAREGMGGWDGEEHYWPELQDFDFEGDSYDRFGDAYKATYQYRSKGNSYVSLFVSFDASEFVNSGGKKAISWEARGAGEDDKGTVRGIEDIAKQLQDSLKWAQGLHKKAEQELRKVGGAKWTVEYNGYDLEATFENDDPYSEATMYVTFDDVEDAVFRGSPGEAQVHFIAGSDYQGHFGEKHERRSFQSIDDMNKVLKEAERLWQGWIKKQA